MSLYSFYSIIRLVTQQNYYFLTWVHFIAEPQAGAVGDQRWRHTAGLPPSFPLSPFSVSVVNRPVASVGPVTAPSGGHHSFVNNRS